MLRLILVVSVTIQMILPSVAVATSRKNPWVYAPRTMLAGEAEYEQWVTWKTDKQSDSDYEEFRIRHEFEWGVTDTFQLALYAADWRHKHTSSSEHTYFRDVALEAIYQIQAPNPEQLGFALYGEIKHGTEFLELEAKLLFELELEHVNLLYNFTVESEWEGQDFDEDKGKVEHALAITHELNPSTTIGMQAVWEIKIDDWDHRGDDIVSIGPSFAHQSNGWWVTVAPLFQVTDIESAPDLQIRMLFGIDF